MQEWGIYFNRYQDTYIWPPRGNSFMEYLQIVWAKYRVNLISKEIVSVLRFGKTLDCGPDLVLGCSSAILLGTALTKAFLLCCYSNPTVLPQKCLKAPVHFPNLSLPSPPVYLQFLSRLPFLSVPFFCL